MLHRILIIFVIAPLFIKAQTSQECGYTATALDLQNYQTKIQSVTTLLPHDTCLNRELSLVFHVVLDSSNLPGFNIAGIDAYVNNLNDAWKPICISFKKCSVNYIPNYNYNAWDVKNEPVFSSSHYVDNTINIVLVDNIVSPPNRAGYADLMGHIVLKKNIITGPIPVHEMGHVFGLIHTFDSGLGQELVRRTNCKTTGDLLCSTEADPYPLGQLSTAPCNFQPGTKDANNDYYTPPLDNYMTVTSSCRFKFTQEQYNLMALTFILSGTQLH